MQFLSEAARDAWWTELDAVAEGAEPRRFLSSLVDRRGAAIAVDVSVTRFVRRRQTLALVVARPIDRR